MERTGMKPTRTKKDNATKRPKTLARKAKHGTQNTGKSEAITSLSSRARRLRRAEQLVLQQPVVRWYGVRERRQNRFGHNGKERDRPTQAGNGRLVAVTATKSVQSAFPRQSRQTTRFCTAQPDFMLERPQRIILDATNQDPWDLRNAAH